MSWSSRVRWLCLYFVGMFRIMIVVNCGTAVSIEFTTPAGTGHPWHWVVRDRRSRPAGTGFFEPSSPPFMSSSLSSTSAHACRRSPTNARTAGCSSGKAALWAAAPSAGGKMVSGVAARLRAEPSSASSGMCSILGLHSKALSGVTVLSCESTVCVRPGRVVPKFCLRWRLITCPTLSSTFCCPTLLSELLVMASLPHASAVELVSSLESSLAGGTK
mmetsp:Transcript_112870/g.314101  ORF Transcript_112870/g.314101 Transcript_112870/m.314101 type:complete len:217 (-) Transcript_112870:180-830(-)